ncbi:hypothetical protein Tco_1276746 [Tanacetum coccineum]
MKRMKNIRKQKAIAKAVSKSEKSATNVEKNESKALRTKLNSQVNVNEMNNFNNYIPHTILVEIPLGGQKFTRLEEMDIGLVVKGARKKEVKSSRPDF